MEKKDVAVVVQNMIQFYSIQSGLDELIKRNYLVDIFIPVGKDDTGMGDIFEATYQALKDTDYNICRESKEDIFYEVLMEPYPLDMYFEFKYKLRVKYPYYLIAAKPNLSYIAENNIYYDYIICFAKPASEYMKVFAKTILLDNTKYVGFKREETKHDKPVLLYLPTYGDTSSITQELIDTFKKLKKKYYIITKKHHGTSYLVNEKDRITILEEIADEVYDQTTSLKDLFNKADVVLSDNSGSIFEAIYCNVPIAIFSDNLNKNKFGEFDTYQYRFVKDGIIPYAKKTSEIEKVIKDALSEEYKEKQKAICKEVFCKSENPAKDFADALEVLIKEDETSRYKKIHDNLLKEYTEYRQGWMSISSVKEENVKQKEEIEKLKEEKEELNKEIEFQKRTIEYYEKGRLYKIANKIYRLNKKNR